MLDDDRDGHSSGYDMTPLGHLCIASIYATLRGNK